jgi:hypothetical protein
MKQLKCSDLEKLSHRYQVMFAIFCAEQVIGLLREPDKEVCLNDINIVKNRLKGEIYCLPCLSLINNPISSNAYAANAIAYTISTVNNNDYSALTAELAADSARLAYPTVKGRRKITLQQWDYYHQLLNLDSKIETILLGETK